MCLRERGRMDEGESGREMGGGECGTEGDRAVGEQKRFNRVIEVTVILSHGQYASMGIKVCRCTHFCSMPSVIITKTSSTTVRGE